MFGIIADCLRAQHVCIIVLLAAVPGAFDSVGIVKACSVLLHQLFFLLHPSNSPTAV